MDFYKAISILGLRPNFTEAEFKTAYRKLSHKYHPDKYEGTSKYELMQKKQQEINFAKEFLKKYNKINPQKKDVNINEYLRYKRLELAKIINIDEIKTSNKDIIATINLIKEDIKKFETDISKIYILQLRTEDIDKSYNECIKNIKIKFETLKNLFYKTNDIRKENVKEQLDYDCTLKEFYYQLQQIEEKYGKISPIKHQILIEMQRYQYLAGYEKIKSLIDESLRNTLNNIKEDNFQNIKKHIDDMHREIIEFFQTYHMQSRIIKELEQEVYNTNNKSIINKYEELKKSFENIISLEHTKLEIEKIKKQIEKHQTKVKKVVDFQQNEQTINTIYKNLLDRHSAVIKNYNIIRDYDTITKINEFLNQVLKVFSKGCKVQKQIEFFENLNQITFININNDTAVIEKSIEDLKQEKSNIYLKNYHKYQGFFYLDEENMIIYRDYIGTITCEQITQEELEQEYTPLEEMLESAVFIGDNRKIFSTLPADFLYETEELIIYYNVTNFRVDTKETLKDSVIVNSKDESLEIFKDKHYLCEMIEKQMLSKIEEYKKQQSTNNTKKR